MNDIKELQSRIKAEFDAQAAKAEQFRSQQVQEHQDRQQRLAQLEHIFDEMRDDWKPRLEALADQFRDAVHVSPSITPGRRQATLEFQSPLARISLTMSASTDSEATKLLLSYDLQILPIFVEFEKHAEIAFPLDQVDRAAAGRWLDDRIVGFVQVYLSLYRNEYYLKDHMVADPVAGIRFPKFVAGATLEREGQTYYFISEQTKREFEARANQGKAKP